ncbi:PLC-like TIM beta alpha-barrel domain protein [Rutstroemia sp. NJR-2017a WRK4]|nr:PLC-like TIM beta alpha-barrel domain protein [Rutstroemia sp. NJR-2017a WRK4]
MRLLVVFPLLFAASTIASTTAQACNGYSELCSRKWSNISQIGTHDSAFDGISPFDNQNVDITKQLDAGIRFLQAQTHYLFGDLVLCHTACEFRYAGPLVDYLTTIKNWLDKNPNEVVTLLLTNGDRKSVSLFGGAITSSALNTYAYTPSKKLAIDEWPTLQEMITSGKRFVVFLDYLANTTLVPYVLDEFQYFFETAFDTTDASSFAMSWNADNIDVERCDWERKHRCTSRPMYQTVEEETEGDARGLLRLRPLATSGGEKADSRPSNIISFFIVMLVSLCAL